MAAAARSPDELAADDDERALTTSLQARHAYINHAELPVLAAAFSTKRGELLVADHRELRLYAGTQQIRRTPLPNTSHGCVPTGEVMLSS